MTSKSSLIRLLFCLPVLFLSACATYQSTGYTVINPDGSRTYVPGTYACPEGHTCTVSVQPAVQGQPGTAVAYGYPGYASPYCDYLSGNCAYPMTYVVERPYYPYYYPYYWPWLSFGFGYYWGSSYYGHHHHHHSTHSRPGSHSGSRPPGAPSPSGARSYGGGGVRSGGGGSRGR
jgi:uncharacterized membrane protein YgcG